MSKMRNTFLAVVAMGLAGLAMADTLDMSPAGSTQFEGPDKPGRGVTMAQVERKFGAPTTKHGAVGEPPITRWDYPGFSVFFEHDRVIHAVRKR